MRKLRSSLRNEAFHFSDPLFDVSSLVSLGSKMRDAMIDANALQRLANPSKVISLFSRSTKFSHSQQPPSPLERIVDTPPPLHPSPALGVEIFLQLSWTNEFRVGVRSRRDDAEDLLDHCYVEEMG